MTTNSFITNRKPSTLKRFLHLLGVIELHTKVNCWFCGQDSFLLPGSRNTVNQWVCPLCDNYNARDSSGEILDPSPHETRVKPETNTKRFTQLLQSSEIKSICSECQKNQELIYDRMSNYIPDENHPHYEFLMENAPMEHRRLQDKYKLCDPCQDLVDTVVRDRVELLRGGLIDRAVSDEVIPKRPSSKSHSLQGVYWYTAHLFVLLSVIYEIVYPSDWSIADLMDATKKIPGVIKCVRKSDFDVVKLFFYTYFYGWTVNIYIFLAIITNWTSLKSTTYHPIIPRLRYEQVKSWTLYTYFQYTVVAARFVSMLLILLQVRRNILIGFLILYILLLTLSIFSARLKDVKSIASLSRSYSTLTDNNDQQAEQEEETIEDDDHVSMMDVDESLSVSTPYTPLYRPVYEDSVIEQITRRFQTL